MWELARFVAAKKHTEYSKIQTKQMFATDKSFLETSNCWQSILKKLNTPLKLL